MKKFLFIILYLLLYLNYSTFPQNTRKIIINIDNPSDYLPEYLDNIYLGMPFKNFINIKDTLFLDKVKSNSPEWFAFKEDVNDNFINNIVYKFDATPDSINNLLPLFQININFSEQEVLDNFLNEKFGVSLIESDESTSQWILKTNKNFVLIVKRNYYEVKLIATIAGADWDPND